MESFSVCYIKEGGSSDSYHFKRTCVLDSILAAFHTMYIKYANVKVLLNSHELLRELMTLLSAEKYVEAKILCVPKLKHVKVDHARKEMDFYGSVDDHSSLFDTLVCATSGNPKPLKDSQTGEEILRYLQYLGAQHDPTLILWTSLTRPLEGFIDEKKRVFELQFLLLGKNDHMTMCFQSYKNLAWYLYDNDATKPPFQFFDLESLKDYEYFVAGYVNITQEPDCKLGVPETGKAAGTRPFCSIASSSHLDRVEVEDPPYSVPETRVELGPQPIVSNQEKPAGDIEMLSFSSDSD